MESIEDGEIIKKCYQIKERLQESVNVCYNESNSTLIFWNKYQIFVYDDFNFEEASKTFVPEFQIKQLIGSNGYLACLDSHGNVHVTGLNFKNSGHKRFKSGFQQKANNVMCFTQYSPEETMSLKWYSGLFSLCLHKTNADFPIGKETVLKLEENRTLLQTTQYECILYCQSLSNLNLENVKGIFGTQDIVWKDSSVILISFDKIHVYACVYNPKTIAGEIELVKVYTGSSKICDIKLQDGSLLVGLTCGTVCRQSLRKKHETKYTVHMNTALHKFLALNDNMLLYTDGISLWKSGETFSETAITFQKLFSKQPKDFVKISDRIICTTYTNLIYSFSINDKNCYENEVLVDLYCPAERLLTNSEYLHQIMKEIESNADLIKKVNDERNHIMALSLSKRPDIMKKVIQTRIVVYESYEEVIVDNSDITLTEPLHHYFEPDSFIFLIQLTTTLMQQTLNEMLSSLLANTRIHISLSNRTKSLKTTSVKLTEPLKKVDLLVPVNGNDMIDITEMRVNIKLVLNLPGCMDAGQSVWTVLYEKDVILFSEHFIKTPKKLKVNIFKEPQEKIEDLVLKHVCHHHGTLFDIAEMPISDSNEWNFYVKLPANFPDIFKKGDYFKNNFSRPKETFLHTNLSSEQFLKSAHKLIFEVGGEIVKLEIINDDFCSPLLKTSSRDVKTSFNMRNFLANVVYNDFKESIPEKEYINYTLYTTTENLQKTVKQSLERRSQEEIKSLAEQFQKNVIGAFPV